MIKMHFEISFEGRVKGKRADEHRLRVVLLVAWDDLVRCSPVSTNII